MIILHCRKVIRPYYILEHMTVISHIMCISIMNEVMVAAKGYHSNYYFYNVRKVDSKKVDTQLLDG